MKVKKQTTEEVINKIIDWQENQMLHSITCGNNSSHLALHPKLKNDVVILYCLDCDYEQIKIPTCVLK